MTTIPSLLFLCTGNTARSQLAQALLEHRAPGRYAVTSAGLWPFEAPAAATGMDEERLVTFRRVRDEIDAKLGAWLATQAARA